MTISTRHARQIREGLRAGRDYTNLLAYPGRSKLARRAYWRGREQYRRADASIYAATQRGLDRWHEMKEKYKTMKQLKIIFKSGADLTIWVEDYAWVDASKYLRVYPAEGHPSVPYVDTSEIAALVELS